MKFGIRKPSLKKRISARTSPKRFIRHNLGLKAPRGMGWLTSPKKAAYNRIYNKTSVSVDTLLGGKSKGIEGLIFALTIGLVIQLVCILFLFIKKIFTNSAEMTLDQTVQKQSHELETDILSNIQANTNSINTPSCPNCATSMVIRIAKRGSNAGNKFWGCSRFPNCKGTRPS